MVLLRGKNYDFAGQQSTILASACSAGATTLTVDNTEGFVDDDYVLIDPYKDTAEIVQITAAVASNTSLTVSATKFAHAQNHKLFRLPYNQMKFYECLTETGTYTVIATATTNLSYADIYTNFDYVAGNTDYYFKRTFYNSTSTTESDIKLSSAWQTNDEQYYVTEEELRVWLQFGQNDYPSRQDLKTFIKLAQMKVDLDVNSSNMNIKRLALLILAKYYVFRALASKSLSKGYVTVNAEGRNVTKAFQEMILEAESCFLDYNKFLRENLTSEVTRTDFMDDTTNITSETRRQITDIMTGTQNALDYESIGKITWGRRRRWR